MINYEIKDRISNLPQVLQMKIYIYSWKQFWKEYIPITSKIPTWMNHYLYIQRSLWKSRCENIHFLHLSFNILPENKKWIMGCQCETCINDTSISLIEKQCHSLIQYRNSAYFSDNLMPEETTGWWNYNITPYGVKVFDPLHGSYKENNIKRKLREKIPIQFDISLVYPKPIESEPLFNFGEQMKLIKDDGRLFIFGK
jgi:hypothetical protein